MEFKLSINTDNVVFGGSPVTNLNEAFMKIAHQIKHGSMKARIEDSNGKLIEEFTFTRENID